MSTVIDVDSCYLDLRTTVLELTGMDLDAYKNRQLSRRLSAFMDRVGAVDGSHFSIMLSANRDLLEEFRNFMTINVSEFFRDTNTFHDLASIILPELLSQNPHLRIWSAGCSHGAEIYSVAMILDSLGCLSECELFGTDIDLKVIERAEQGVYGERDVRSVPPLYRQRYFSQSGPVVTLAPRIREHVTFSAHNLLCDPMLPEVDLVICRNVVIYFTAEARDQLHKRFNACLKPGGYLFTGGTETIFDSKQLGFVFKRPCFYQKPLLISPTNEWCA